ncbi:hypothetical protein DENSPDRAFT_419651 [Dentipellis sp. KUC8613]|nr:hypothetical protein DENSPDRAFT_419651 [Dentipellis sp. KUC8613]
MKDLSWSTPRLYGEGASADSEFADRMNLRLPRGSPSCATVFRRLSSPITHYHLLWLLQPEIRLFSMNVCYLYINNHPPARKVKDVTSKDGGKCRPSGKCLFLLFIARTVLEHKRSAPFTAVYIYSSALESLFMTAAAHICYSMKARPSSPSLHLI